MDFNSFINNLRAGLAQADQQANNFINQAGNELGKALNLWSVPIQAAGNQIGQLGGQIGQGMQQSADVVNNGAAQAGNAVAAMTGNTRQATGITSNPVYQAAVPLAIQNTLNGAQQNQAQQPTVSNYYYRDPAIDSFVNTLRFMMNPIRGITGWTPLDMTGDLMSDSLYSAFGKKYTPTTTGTTSEATGTIANTTDTTNTTTETTNNKAEETADEGEYVTYTYKPGDNFGQVILDLGLGTNKGLWGADGDVEYYAKQLLDQGIWGNNIPANIPIGTTIKLKRRKI